MAHSVSARPRRAAKEAATMKTRTTVGLILVSALVLGSAHLATALGDPHASPAAAPALSARPNLADHALRMLQEGNDRFMAGKCNHPNTDVFRIADTGGNGQHPFAVVVTCADSRVPVERLFDRGVGDLFVIRVAGNICDPNEAGSIEYACEHLGSQLVVVMGHSKCGAVTAAISGGDAGKNINSLLDNIAPAVQSVRAAHAALAPADLVDAVVHENVWQSIEDMYRSSESMRELVSSGAVKVVGAVYDIQTGRVDWMGQHPMQTALVKGGDASTTITTREDAKSVAPAAPLDGAKQDKAEKSGKPLAEKTGFVKPSTTAQRDAEKKAEDDKPSSHASHPH